MKNYYIYAYSYTISTDMKNLREVKPFITYNSTLRAKIKRKSRQSSEWSQIENQVKRNQFRDMEHLKETNEKTKIPRVPPREDYVKSGRVPVIVSETPCLCFR